MQNKSSLYTRLNLKSSFLSESKNTHKNGSLKDAIVRICLKSIKK